MNVVLNMLLGIHMWYIHIYIYLILLTTYIPSYTLPVLVREENPKILGFNLQDYVHMYDSYIVHVQPVATMTTKLEA